MPDSTSDDAPAIPRKPRPRTRGNVWHLQETSDGALQYLSDQWQGSVMGFEERDGITLAQSSDVAIGMVAFGGGSCGVTRSLPHRWPYHMRDASLSVHEWDLAAESHAFAWLQGQHQKHHALPTVICVSAPVASTLERDALEGSDTRQNILARLAEARSALQPWGKILYVDRLSLSLLEGAPTISQSAADFHYAAVAKNMCLDIARTTGQAGLPTVVVSQSAGTSQNGDSEVILAEGRLHLKHFSLNIVVATPLYPFSVVKGTLGTLGPRDALLVAEIESLAVEANLAGKDWFCPTLEEAWVEAGEVRIRCKTMDGLVIDDESPHGFAVENAQVTSVRIEDDVVILELDAVPDPLTTVRYAWGCEPVTKEQHFANHGGLRDNFSTPSRSTPNTTIHRYALANRLPIKPKR